jgi:signal transduction histidine kinase
VQADISGEAERGVAERVQDCMSSDVVSLPVGASLLDAARLLARNGISCVVIVDGDHPVGIISERDLVREVAREGASWSERPLSEVMSHPLYVTDTTTTLSEAIGQLRERHVRRLPVVTREGHVAGIVTQTDLLRASHERLLEYAGHLERLVTERTGELQTVEQRRDDLVDLTAHDIKNSLCVIDSALEMVDEDAQPVGPFLPILRRASERIGHLVRLLLDVNRLEAGVMPLRVQEAPWATMSDPVVAEASVLATARGVEILRRGETRLIVRCDPQLVERILLNLIDNAISVAPHGSAIEVHAENAPSGGFLVRVANRGTAIPPDVLPTLFGKYRQGGTGIAKRYGGWGLGLAFCRLAVERHGGSIRAISPWVDGEGAAFEFTIPADPR